MWCAYIHFWRLPCSEGLSCLLVASCGGDYWAAVPRQEHGLSVLLFLVREIPNSEAEQPKLLERGQEWPTKLLLLLLLLLFYRKTARAVLLRRCVLARRNATALSATMLRACTPLQRYYSTAPRDNGDRCGLILSRCNLVCNICQFSLR